MDHQTSRSRRCLVVALTCLSALVLAGCATPSGASTPDPSSSAATGGACGAPFPCGELPVGFSVEGPAGWRDVVAEGGHRWLAPEVATDPTKERWADIAVYRPTLAFDPITGAPGVMPADLPGWFRQSRMLRVVDEEQVTVDGVAATQLDVEYTERIVNTVANGYLNNPSGSKDDGSPFHERWVLVPLDDGWIVVQASTLRGLVGITAPTEPDDKVSAVLASIALP